jgi:histidinol-phosphate aminotransferase/threonine-phosphate decarboxylase
MDPDAVDQLRRTHESSDDPDVDSGTSGSVAAGRVPHGGDDDPTVLDFSANTNPRSPDGVVRVYESALAAARSYPSDEYAQFRAAAADHVGCTPEQVIPTPGGLAAIRLAIEMTVSSGDSVLVPEPTFGEFAREVRLQGADPVFRPYDEILTADPDSHALAIVCNPNNPTGNAYDPAALRSFADRCRGADTALLVDEAFLGFTDQPSIAGREGVIVSRALTKLFGLPGLRAGFAVATGRYRDRLETARRTWSLGTPAAAVGTHCLGDSDFVSRTRTRVARERERLRTRLASRFTVYPSDAPFLLLEVGDAAAVDDLLDTARRHGITLRDARTFRGLDSHVRVAVRTPSDNERLLDALL